MKFIYKEEIGKRYNQIMKGQKLICFKNRAGCMAPKSRMGGKGEYLKKANHASVQEQ